MGLLYALTLLLNALLLFLVQPMIAKMLLPYLGGAPAVWNTCMLYFQLMLLGGYAYAHAITKKLSFKLQIAIHLALFTVAAFVLPFAISENALNALRNGAQPIGWVLGQLLLLVGAPFLMLATNGPLLQHWFAQTDHPDAHDPYFLYGASNAGSLLALIGYPLLMEPALRLRQQSLTWAVSYVGLLLLLGGCACVRWQVGRQALQVRRTEETVLAVAGIPLNWQQRGRWVLLAFVPSSLMLAVTSHLSTNLSPFPLLWVIPLALYLLTFIFAFAQRQFVSTQRLAQILPGLGILLLLLVLAHNSLPMIFLFGLPLCFFFAASWLCHRLLAESRPTAEYLTEFYLWLSVGGMLGGAFNSLLAPYLFSRVWEYPLMAIVAVFIRPRKDAPPRLLRERSLDFALPVALGLLAFCLGFSLPRVGLSKIPTMVLALSLPALLGWRFITRPIYLGATLAAIILCGNVQLDRLIERPLWQERNFFGVKRVVTDQTGRVRELGHGNTIHGRQFIDAQRQCEPLSYYHQQGPVGQLFAALQTKQVEISHVASVGLGTGSLASYALPQQDWTYFEIDPGIVQVAEKSGHFTFLKKCSRAPYRIVTGDARLQLHKATDQQFGLLVLDAFSSDAVPTHLLTQEAMELYLSKLAFGGSLAIHISNNYLDLRPVVAGLAQRAGLVCLINDDFSKQMAGAREFQQPAIWVALARRPEDLGNLPQHPQWRQLQIATPQLWTDDYSNLLNVFKR